MAKQAKVKEKIVMTEEDIARALRRIAHQIVEANRGVKDLVFVGIIARGATLAKRLAKMIQAIEGEKKVPVGSLDVSLYRDDIMIKGKYIEVRKSSIPFSIDNKIVILVDDVIFHGRTIRAALDGLKDYGRASKVQLACLVDRGHRELPIHADFVGKKIPTSKTEDVKLKLMELDGAEEVSIA